MSKKKAGTLSTEQKDSIILETVRTDGWGLISEMAQARINGIKQQLETSQFNDLKEISFLQGELKGLQTVLNYGNNRLEKILRERVKK